MGCEIWFQAWHEGAMWSREDFAPVRIEQVWDTYRDQMVLEESGAPEDLILTFHENRRESRGKILGPELGPVEMTGPDEFVMRFQEIDAPAVREAYRLWLFQIIGREAHREADDGTYDYYPDCWFVARQLGVALGMKKEYNHAVDALRAATEYGDEGTDLFELVDKI